jgi:hypothetical protein
MKILEFKRSGIGLIAEFRGIPNRFPNQALGERDGKLRAMKTTMTSMARMATSPTTTTNTPLALTVPAIGPKMQQSTVSWRQR